MKRVLLDTDVILDLFLGRAPFDVAAAELWDANAKGVIEIYVAGITPISLFYFAAKTKGKVLALRSVEELLAAVNVCFTDQSIYTAALKLPIPDYEDAVQVANAQAASIDAIVTRNLSDYKFSPVPVYSPTDFFVHLALP